MSRRLPSLLLLLAAASLVLLSLSSLPVADGLSVHVRAKSERCFSEQVNKGEKVVGSWAVSDGGKLDVDVRVLGPDGKVVYERERATEGSFIFKAVSEGQHTLCLDNRMSSLTGKTVAFDLFVGAALHRRDAASAAALTPLESGVVSTSEGVHAMGKALRYAKAREDRHAQTVDSTNGRVVACSMINVLAIVSVAGAQVIVIRRMFEKKRKY
jgi:hypothetical protein